MRASDTIAVGIMLLLALLLQGCGRKGPLYLQQMPPAPVSETPAQATPALVPAAQSGVPQVSPMQNPPVLQNSTEPVKQP